MNLLKNGSCRHESHTAMALELWIGIKTKASRANWVETLQSNGSTKFQTSQNLVDQLYVCHEARDAAIMDPSSV